MASIFLTGSQPIEKPLGLRGKAFGLIRLLQEAGYSISESPKSDLLFAIDHNAKAYKSFLENGGHREKSFLLRLEPESVYPLQYRNSVEQKYICVFSPGRLETKLEENVFLPWCYRFDENPLLPIMNSKNIGQEWMTQNQTNEVIVKSWNERPHFLTMITSNKISADKSSNYSIRRTIAHELAKDGLKVYGFLWNVGLLEQFRYRIAVLFFFLRCRMWFPLRNFLEGFFFRINNYYGSPKNKHLILRESRFSIVIENSNNYISEKLLDCLINGAIPIYIGPEISKFGIPKEVAIQGTTNPIEIRKRLQNLTSDETKTLLLAAHDFLKSDDFRLLWNEEYVFSKIINQISQVIRKK